ncbi:glycosyltransferase [Clostridium perfringens]|uniref:glycosyltransferase n=1 Tax=Clostridium perfringens TaxID=1502 RepID=UPI002AC3DE9B|nr:glycosyltransferase [Clostridium perfringens]MDK0841040.1 glycosyltransferase [Clostridium perfringens]MDZ4937186.1 glycosyltransferase [Clostridium perfringens]
MKNIIIIDTGFPFDKIEPFLETEINYYNDINIYLAPCMINNKKKFRNINNRFVNIFDLPEIDNRKLLRIIKKSLRGVKVFFNKLFYFELFYLISNKKLNFGNIKSLIIFLIDSDYIIKKLKNIIKKTNLKNDDILIYSYWMHIHAYIGIKIKEYLKNGKVITRCHRYDLYEYANDNNYIPMRNYIIKNIDRIYSISDDGKDYLKKQYNIEENKIKISRLGTIDYGIQEWKDDRLLRIVSCSWVVKVKRVEKIVEALSNIKDISIEWVHFGDGNCLNDVKEKAKNLSENINCIFKGAVSNKDILKYYKENSIDIFLNVSESEGIPVSIMEVQSFGVPVIATDVGGVSEQVFNYKNGILIDKEFLIEDLIKSIRLFWEMDLNEYLRYRKESREIWESKYSADKNYNEFICNLKKEF